MEFRINESTSEQIREHLIECSESFIPALSSYVEIESYSTKLHRMSTRIEAYENLKMIGLIALYEQNEPFITNVSVCPDFIGTGLSQKLLENCISYINSTGHKTLTLEVKKENSRALNFYKKNRFRVIEDKKNSYIMKMNNSDYDKESVDNEQRNYFYNFDSDIMHHYMIKSFEPFFDGNEVLELGSFRGDFTLRLKNHFTKITCVEASKDASEYSKIRFGEEVEIINATFEDLKINKRFKNVILTHVLEHIDDPVELLRKIKSEWLSEDGNIFIVCPNANAPSRQIAVKMGLISHNSAVTESESIHGHRITYSLDTLERDCKLSGLDVVHRSGIFFKAFANFQWDKILETDIIDNNYLDGCYYLGQQYPDLCASIFLLCR